MDKRFLEDAGMTDIVMPRLSDTMEEGTILRWLKRDGEHVRRGEELVEIETDKANMTYESDRDGVLQTVAREGDTLAVGEPIAHIGDALQTAPAGNGAPTAQRSRVKASPLARRIARESGVDLSTLTGSGPGGRIVKADVEASQATAPTPPAQEHPPAPATEKAAPSVGELASAKGRTTVVELSRTQRAIARRMAESKATIPDFALQTDVDMERCVALRSELKRLSQTQAPVQAQAPTYNDMIVKACALALREHPRANGSYRDGRFELHGRVNIGVAVAVDAQDPLHSALVVPTVFDADQKSLGEVARETLRLAERVRDGSITPPELSGATFTVSNLGMYAVRSFTAIVNPPQAAILAVGSVERRASVRDGDHDRDHDVRNGDHDRVGYDKAGGDHDRVGGGVDGGGGGDGGGDGGGGGVFARHAMTVTLSCDHRILYGADAALFLGRVRELLEEPAALTL